MPVTTEAKPAESGTELACVEGRLLYVRFQGDLEDDGGRFIIAVLLTRDGERISAKGTVADCDALEDGRTYRLTGTWGTYRGERQLEFVLAQEVPGADHGDLEDYL